MAFFLLFSANRYINPESAIMRGPMIANMMKQLLMDTDWGALDYLVIDMPPGKQVGLYFR